MSAAVQDAKLQVEKAGVPKNKQLGIIIKLARKELADRAFDEGQLEEMVKALQHILVLAGIGWVDLFWEELYPPQFKILGVLVLSLSKMVLTPIRPHSSIG